MTLSSLAVHKYLQTSKARPRHPTPGCATARLPAYPQNGLERSMSHMQWGCRETARL